MRIRIRIRIQHFFSDPDPDPVLDPGFWWPKIGKILKVKKNLYFFDQILQFTYTYASIKDALATGEAFRSQKRTSSNSKHEISLLFLCLWVIFALLDPDPDPVTQINADPCWSGSGYGSATLVKTLGKSFLQRLEAVRPLTGHMPASCWPAGPRFPTWPASPSSSSRYSLRVRRVQTLYIVMQRHELLLLGRRTYIGLHWHRWLFLHTRDQKPAPPPPPPSGPSV